MARGGVLVSRPRARGHRTWTPGRRQSSHAAVVLCPWRRDVQRRVGVRGRELAKGGVSFCYPASLRRGLTQWSSGAYGAATYTLTGRVVWLAVVRYLELSDPAVALRRVVKGMRLTHPKARFQQSRVTLKAGETALEGVRLRVWDKGRILSVHVYSVVHRGRVTVVQVLDRHGPRGRSSAEGAATLKLLRGTLRLTGR